MVTYIYMTINKINGMKYIGKRTYEGDDPLKDRYIGSGKLFTEARKKFRPHNFEKKILEICSEEDAQDREKYYTNLFNASNDPSFYNMVSGGSGHNLKENNGMYGKNHTEETKKKCVAPSFGENNGMYGKKHTAETRDKCVNPRFGKDNGMYGKGYKLEGSKNGSAKGIEILIPGESEWRKFGCIKDAQKYLKETYDSGGFFLKKIIDSGEAYKTSKFKKYGPIIGMLARNSK